MRNKQGNLIYGSRVNREPVSETLLEYISRFRESGEDEEDEDDISSFPTPIGLPGQRIIVDVPDSDAEEAEYMYGMGYNGLTGEILEEVSAPELPWVTDEPWFFIFLDQEYGDEGRYLMLPRQWIKLDTETRFNESVEDEDVGDISEFAAPATPESLVEQVQRIVMTLSEGELKLDSVSDNPDDEDGLLLKFSSIDNTHGITFIVGGETNEDNPYPNIFQIWEIDDDELLEELQMEGTIFGRPTIYDIRRKGQIAQLKTILRKYLKRPVELQESVDDEDFGDTDAFATSPLLGKVVAWKTLRGESHRGPIVELDGNVAYIDCEICGERIAVEDGAYDFKKESRMTYGDILHETRLYENAEDIAQDLSRIQSQPIESPIPPPPDASYSVPASSFVQPTDTREQQVQTLFTKYYPTMGTSGAVQQISKDLAIPYAAAHAMVTHYLSQFSKNPYDKDWSESLPGDQVDLVSTGMTTLSRPDSSIPIGTDPETYTDSEFSVPEYGRTGQYYTRRPYGESVERGEEEEDYGDVSSYEEPGWRNYFIDYVIYGPNGNEYYHAKFTAPGNDEALQIVIENLTGRSFEKVAADYETDDPKEILNNFSNSDMDIIEIYSTDENTQVYTGLGDFSNFDSAEDTVQDEDWDEEDE